MVFNYFYSDLSRQMKIAQKLVINYFRAKLNLLSVISKKRAAERAFKLFCTPLRKSKPKFPAIFKTGEPLQFELDGYVIHGYRWNKSMDKKALIVHGFESSSKNFDRYIHALIKNNYQVLVFDAPAHGKSTGQRITLPLYLAGIRRIRSGNERFARRYGASGEEGKYREKNKRPQRQDVPRAPQPNCALYCDRMSESRCCQP